MKRPWFKNRFLVSSILVFFISSSIQYYPQLTFAQTQDQPTEKELYDQAREELAIFFRELKKERAKINETSFNATALAQYLGSDIADLFIFVRDEIQFETYEGVLRLADGTLMSRAGNAHDQSLLLAALLRQHGYETRYAFGTLSQSQARTLLSVVPLPVLDQYLIDVNQIQTSTIGDMSIEDVQELMNYNEEMKATFFKDVSREFSYAYSVLPKRLKEEGIEIHKMAGVPIEELIGLTQNHSWVQVKQEDQWIDLDPTFLANEVGQAVVQSTRTEDGFGSDEFAHKLKFTVNIEQTKGDAKELKSVLETQVNLTETLNDIRIVMMPEISGSVTESFSNPEFARSFSVLVPIITVNGVPFPGAPFDFEGEILSTDLDIRNASKTKKAIGDGFGAMGGILGNMFEDEASTKISTPELSRVMITISRITPSGSTKTIQRDLIIRSQDEGLSKEDAQFDIRRQALSSHNILASASRFNNAFMIAKYQDYYLANKRGHFLMLAYKYHQEVSNVKEVLDSKLTDFSFEALEYLHTRSSLMEEIRNKDFEEFVHTHRERHTQ